jgi:hypothetical protein
MWPAAKQFTPLDRNTTDFWGGERFRSCKVHLCPHHTQGHHTDGRID